VTFSLVGSIAATIIYVLTAVGLTGLFALMVVESFGIPPIPSEIILPFTGYLVVTGVFPLLPAIALALVGGLVGSFAAYAVGRWWRARITGVGFGPFRLEERHLARVDRWFDQHGEGTVLFARMVPVVRSYVSYPAGSARMSPARFGVFTLLGTTPFTLALIYAGIVLGAHWRVVEGTFQYLDYLLIALLIAAVVYFLVIYFERIRKADAAAAASAPTGTPPPASPPPSP